MTAHERVVVNTGPLIALTRGDVIDLLGKLPYKFLTTHAVLQELRAGNPAVSIRDVELVGDPEIPLPLLWDLDAGESSVIQLALDRGISLVCIDEKLGRRQAEALGLRVFGTLGIVRKAKELGLVELARPIIDKMRAEGVWYQQRLVNRVLGAVGE